MKQFQQLALTATLIIASMPAPAVTVVQCEDERGAKSFQNQCPPGTKQVGAKDYSTAAGTPAAQPLPELVLYLVPDCDSCAQVKEFLSVRNISVTEKNVATDPALQQELKDKAGDLRVPLLLIGDQKLAGYNREALLNALTAAGYKEPNKEPAEGTQGAAQAPAGEEE